MVRSNKGNGPKVESPGDVRPGLPLAGAISRWKLAICWEPRESGATAKILDAVTMRPVRTISRKGLETGKPASGILRDQTPATSLARGEVMVRAAWRHAEHSSEIPCRVSSDLHEWCNDLTAVSCKSSAKL